MIDDHSRASRAPADRKGRDRSKSSSRNRKKSDRPLPLNGLLPATTPSGPHDGRRNLK